MKNQQLKSVWQLINTVVPFVVLWYLAYKSLSVSYLLALVPSLLAAGFMTRIFIIFMIVPIIHSLKVDVQIE